MAYFLTGNCLLKSFVTITFLVFVKASRLKCPMNVNIEKGNNMTISCLTNITGLSAAYWYKNNPSLSGPMLRMEEGKRGGLEYQKGNYDITSAGNMVIINADANQEAVYWFLAYFKDEIFEQKNVTVNITTTPYQACPVIDGCPSCSQCSKLVNQSGTLKCSVTESRPKITVEWIIKYGKGIEIFKPTFLAQNDFFTDTWNTSTEISFFAPSCNEEVVLQCMAQDTLKLLKTRYSLINIYTENCTVSPTEGDDISPKPTLMVVALACVVIISTLFISVICLVHFFKKKQKNRKNIKEYSPSEYILNVSKDNEHSLHIDNGTTKSNSLVSALKEAYKKCFFYKLLPWEIENISVNEFYTTCLYEVTSSDGNSFILSSDHLLTDKNIKAARQVLLHGNSGTGKTLLFKHILQTWVTNDSNFILIFASLCGATEDTELIEIIEKTTKTQNKFFAKELYEVIKSQKCLLLFDGLDQMSHNEESGKSKSESVASNSHEKKDFQNSLTVKDILRAPNEQGFANVNVWISTRDIQHSKKYELCPCYKLKFAGINEEKISSCIRKSCSHYNALARQNCFIPSFGGKDSPGEKEDDFSNTNDFTSDQTSIKAEETEELMKKSPEGSEKDEFNDKDQTSSKEEEMEELIQKHPELSKKDDFNDKPDTTHTNVSTFLRKNDLMENFKEIPQLLFLTLHITSALFVRDKFLKTVNPWNIVTLMEVLLQYLCLEKQYLLEDDLRKFLEQTAFNLTFKGIAFSGSASAGTIHDRLKVATAMKILQKQTLTTLEHNVDQNGTVSETMTPKLTNFTNKYFQDYFCACGVVRNSEVLQILKENVSKCKEIESLGLIKFLFNMQVTPGSFRKDFCNFCINAGWFNNVIECLFEGLEPEEEKKTIAKIKNKVLTIYDLENNYYRSAVTKFCQKCKEINVQLKEMRFWGECLIPFQETIELSSVKQICFIQRKFAKREFVELLTKLTEEGGTKELRFVECVMEDISSEVAHIRALKNKGPKVHKIDDAKEGHFSTLNYDSAKWDLGKLGTLLSTMKF